MNKMAQAFNTTVAALEDELTQLILEGLINARIDSHSKVRQTLPWPRPPVSVFFFSNIAANASSDSVRERRGPEEHDVREVAPHGQRVPETSQSHDPPSSCAAQPDPRQGEKINPLSQFCLAEISNGLTKLGSSLKIERTVLLKTRSCSSLRPEKAARVNLRLPTAKPGWAPTCE